MKNLNLYTILGINKNANSEEIKKAYYKKAKEFHPDSTGEDSNEEFQKINLAYQVLFDKEKRKQYDETGYYDNIPIKTKEESAFYILREFLLSIVQNNMIDINTINIIELMKESLKSNKKSIDKQIAEQGILLEKVKNIKRRLMSKEDKTLFLFLDNYEQLYLNSIDKLKKDYEIGSTAFNILENYKYKSDAVMKILFDSTNGVSSTNITSTF